MRSWTGSGRIVGFQEKPAEPRSSIESIALYIFPAAVLPMFGEYLAGGNADAPGFFLEWLHSRAPVYAWLFERPCTDVGSLEAFWKANRRVVESGGLETALLLDHHPPVEPAQLREDLSEVLAALERDGRLYLACLYTDAGRVPVYEALLRERSPRFPVAVKSRDDLPDLERPGVLRELGSSRSFHVARLQARPDWAEPRPAPARPPL